MNWYIGQRIVAIQNSLCGRVKKGEEYNIIGLRASLCKCKEVQINIGLTGTAKFMQCAGCNSRNIPNGDHFHWKCELLFAPLDQDISALTDILKEPKKETA